LTDGTVVLDAFRPEDTESHLAGEDEEQARRFGWIPRRSTLAGVRATIARWHDQWSTQGPVRAIALRLADSEELVGGCELRIGDGGTASMSYWTFPVFRRCGLATRAVVLVTRYAFDTLSVTEIEVEIEPDNVASRGVAQRAGFTAAGTTRASPRAGAAPRTMLLFRLRAVPPPSSAPVCPHQPEHAVSKQPMHCRRTQQLNRTVRAASRLPSKEQCTTFGDREGEAGLLRFGRGDAGIHHSAPDQVTPERCQIG
jgi:RimJ/RimL family protein N-acetyltransferase